MVNLLLQKMSSTFFFFSGDFFPLRWHEAEELSRTGTATHHILSPGHSHLVTSKQSSTYHISSSSTPLNKCLLWVFFCNKCFCKLSAPSPTQYPFFSHTHHEYDFSHYSFTATLHKRHKKHHITLISLNS